MQMKCFIFCQDHIKNETDYYKIVSLKILEKKIEEIIMNVLFFWNKKSINFTYINSNS